MKCKCRWWWQGHWHEGHCLTCGANLLRGTAKPVKHVDMHGQTRWEIVEAFDAAEEPRYSPGMNKLGKVVIWGFALWGMFLTLLMVLAVSGAWHFFHAHFG